MKRRGAWIHPGQAKTAKAICIPLGDKALEVLKKQMSKHLTRVFNYQVNPVSKAGKCAWRKALKRATIENFRWHDLRYAWASWQVKKGTPLDALIGRGR
jgi:integrase